MSVSGSAGRMRRWMVVYSRVETEEIRELMARGDELAAQKRILGILQEGERETRSWIKKGDRGQPVLHTQVLTKNGWQGAGDRELSLRERIRWFLRAKPPKS